MALSKRCLQLYFLSILSVPSFALPHIDLPYPDLSRRNYKPQPRCKSRPLGLVHPYPDPSKSTITITKQGQPVTTYIPTATRCAENACTDLYSTSTYNWYSTWLPGPYGLQFVTRGDDTITLPPAACATCGPQHRLQSHYCSTNGIHTVNGQLHRVHDAPRYVHYAVEVGYNYQITDVDSYFQWLHNKTSGVTVDVQNVNCADGICTQKVQTWRKDHKVKKVARSVNAEFKGYCGRPGACKLSAYVPGYGKMETVVWVKAKGVVTRVSAQQLTVTRTHTVTSTITKKRKTAAASSSSISRSCTSSAELERITSSQESTSSGVTSSSSVSTTRATSSSAVPTPEIEPEFLLALAVDPSIKGRKVRRQGSKLNPDYFVRFESGDLTFSKNGWDGLRFSLSDGELTANGGYLKAFVDASTTSILPRPESAPARMGIPQTGDIIATISSFYNGFQHVLVWDTRKIAVGTALAQFCVRKGVDAEGGRVFVYWDAVAPDGCEPATLFIPTGFVPPPRPPATMTKPTTSFISSLSAVSSSGSLSSGSQGAIDFSSSNTLSTLIPSQSTDLSSIITSSTSIPTETSTTSISTEALSSNIPTETSSSNVPTETSSSSTSTETS
ncbi:hypothetical protein TWF281_008585 [Arthrobotrys megalospora]